MWKRLQTAHIIPLFSVLLAVGALAVLVGYFLTTQDAAALEIATPLDHNNTLPVYAQFVVTQTLHLTQPLVVTRLEIPMEIPVSSRPLQIDLRQDGHLVGRWRRPMAIPGPQPGVVSVLLPFVVPLKLSGQVEATVAAPSITDATKETAPRLFVEMAGDRYPDGNYRIAHNEKQGDIGLRLVTAVTNWNVVQKQWNRYPFSQVAVLARWVLLIFLLATVPSVVVRFFETLRGTNQ